MLKKKIIVIIPAKMNSVGIKKKNLKLVNGNSLINITISHAIKLNPHKIFVSSEDKNLTNKIIKKKNIIFHLRDKKLSRSNVHAIHVVLDVIKNYNIDKNALVAMMLPTSHLREIYKIKKNIKNFDSTKYYSLIAVTKTQFNSNNIRYLDKYNNLTANDFGLQQRQEAKKVFYVNGSFYMAKCENLIKFKNFHNSKNMKPIFCDPKLSIDINNKSDLKAVKKKFN